MANSVVPDGTSPEHGPKKTEDGSIKIVEGHRTHLDGVSYDQQLCWDLFTNTIEASEALGVDEEFRKQLEERRSKLLGPQIGKWGQLQEWMEDIDDPKSQHRHVSHMLAVFPGTPNPSEEHSRMGGCGQKSASSPAATATRAGARYSSSVCLPDCWTRKIPTACSPTFYSPKHTATFGPLTRHFKSTAISATQPRSMKCWCSPTWERIHLLPALPEAWPEGQVRGMKVRGGFEMDLAWKDGKLTKATLRSSKNASSEVSIRLGDKVKEVSATENGVIDLSPADF